MVGFSVTIVLLTRPTQRMPQADLTAGPVEIIDGANVPAAVPPESRLDHLVPVASFWHMAAVLALIGSSAYRGWANVGRIRLSPDRIAIYERTILFEWLGLGLVFVGLWLRGTPLIAVMGERWRSAGQFFRDLGFGILFLVLTIFISSIAGPHGGDDGATQFLLPQARMEMFLWVLLSLSAGICEEAVYRGYLQKQFATLTGNIPAGIIISAVVFGAAHSYQGLGHAAVISLLGALAGVLAWWRRTVRPGMIAHTLQDVLGGFLRH